MQTQKPCGLHCIKINNITVKAEKEEIISDINLHIHCGKLTVIIGQNGAGKSTLIKAILNEIPHTGSIDFKDIKSNTIKNLKIGYVPQKINIDKNSPSSVYDLLAGFNSKIPIFLKKSKRLYKEISEQLSVFGASDLIDQPISNLSGGELQRVLLCVATNPIPNLLILDEPVSGVDKNGIADFYKTIDKLRKEYDLAIILISHDLDFVAKYADEVVLINKKIIQKGCVNDVYNSKEFLDTFGFIPMASAEVEKCK